MLNVKNLSLLGLLTAVFVVGLSVQACGSDDDLGKKTDVNGTDPSCRPATCSTLTKNCGIVSDGCGGNLRCGTCAGTDNDCRSNVCERGCTSDTECPTGGACINGSCSDKCSTSSDCLSGQSCQAGSCRENAAQSCRYDSDCRADERCTSGACLGNSTGNRTCRYDSECRGGESCRDGRCQNLGAKSCRYHSDCNSNETCTNGYCSSQDNSCRHDSECDRDETCSYGACTGGGNRRINAQCISRGLSVSLPFGSFDLAFENWFYDDANATGKRVDSCSCRTNGTMIIGEGETRRSISCTSCVKSGSDRTCYN